MTCNHCKATVEESIRKLPGISSVDADIISGKVKLTGENFNLDQIRLEVESAGYNWGGIA
jgi:copper chaperone CopZ